MRVNLPQGRERYRPGLDLQDAAHGSSNIGFVYPEEGYPLYCDCAAILKESKRYELAHEFLDFLLRPDVAAKNATAIAYASGVAGAVALLSESLRNDSAVYPPPEARARLVPMRARSQEYTRSLMRMWTRFKTGQ